MSSKDDEERLKRKHEQLLRYESWNSGGGSRHRNYVRSFTLRLSGTRLCARSAGADATVKKSPLVLAPCLRGKDFTWFETQRRELVLSRVLCLDASSGVGKADGGGGAGGPKRLPRLMKCHGLGEGQEWRFRSGEQSTALYNMAAGLCLGTSGRHT